MATRTIATDIVLKGEKEFNDAMKSVNNNLRNLKSDMSVCSAEFDKNADSMEALEKKNKILSASVEQHGAKVDALQRMYDRMISVHGEASSAADKYRQDLNYATAALLKEKKALEDNESAMEKLKAEAKKAGETTEELADSVKKAGSEIENSQKSYKTAISGYLGVIDKLAEAKDKLDEVVEKHKKAGELLKLAAAPAALSTKGIALITKASVVATGALAALGATGVTAMVGFASEAAEAARAAQEAGEPLTQTQQQWLSFANSLDGLEASSARAKSAMGMILLPALRDLSTEGADLLDSFSRDMEAAASSPEQQGKIMADYIVKAAQMLREKIPEYVQLGKELVSGLGDGLSESGPELIDMGADLAFDLLDGIIDNAPAMADAGMMLMQRFIQSLIDRGPDAVASGAEMVEQIILGLAQNAPALIPAAGELILQLVMALLLASPDLLAAGGELVMSIVEGFINMLGLADDAGAQVVSHIKNGIAKAWDSLVSWFDGIWNSLFNRSVDVDVNGSGGGSNVDGSHASGLDYVPFDGYLAKLHKGEMVLNSFDADRYRTSKGATTTKVVNLTINAKSLTSADIDMVIDEVNRKLGEDL